MHEETLNNQVFKKKKDILSISLSFTISLDTWSLNVLRKKPKEMFSLLLLLSHVSRVWLCATPQTAAHQAPPSLGFSRQEYWSGVQLPSPMFSLTFQQVTHPCPILTAPLPHLICDLAIATAECPTFQGQGTMSSHLVISQFLLDLFYLREDSRQNAFFSAVDPCTRHGFGFPAYLCQ